MLTKEQLWGSRIDIDTASPLFSSRKERNQLYPKCVIGIDRDGVINEIKEKSIISPDDFEPIPHSLEAVALLRSLGHKIVLIYDQPGISKGELTMENVDNMNEHLMKLLGESGCPSIDGLYYCTSSMKMDIYAKPNDGMFRRAEKEQGVNFKEGYYVGDSIEDLEVAVKIKSIPVLVKTGNYQKTLQQLNTFSKRKLKSKVKIFDSLWDFACFISNT